MSTIPSWTKLELFPFVYPTIALIDGDQIFGIPTKNLRTCNDSDGIYLFNHNKNQWTKQISFPSIFLCYAQSTAYDHINRLLYVSHGLDYHLLQFDLRKNKFMSFIKTPFEGSFGRMVYVNDTLNVICMNDNKHYILEHKTNTFKEVHTDITSFSELHGHELVYLKSQKRMLLFGGKVGWSKNVNTIYQFSIIDKKWSKLDIEMPMKMSFCGIVSTQNERYIIILGGERDKNSDSIFIFDTKINSFCQSKVLCPFYGDTKAAITSNPNSDKLLSFGYVNECYKANNFKNIQKLPYYLIELINRWVCIQYVHLFQVKTGKHWKINVDDVLTSID